ncbi:hypothetical protein GUJ93_ZPchr0002g25089 [Zizania palustris]|uniref:Uncharacterized protein n=1 Tax=Zizania palustris TaxID=103762 RepID=A0A8J5V3F8_ZIZPA|nr:hypothetical protein GUJ93_ZPchr0002g25089 [Zizania palustris]
MYVGSIGAEILRAKAIAGEKAKPSTGSEQRTYIRLKSKNMERDSEAQKAELQHPINVSQHEEKKTVPWVCRVCQAHCSCESNLLRARSSSRKYGVAVCARPNASPNLSLRITEEA